jgi:hypothetical protein
VRRGSGWTISLFIDGFENRVNCFRTRGECLRIVTYLGLFHAHSQFIDDAGRDVHRTFETNLSDSSVTLIVLESRPR